MRTQHLIGMIGIALFVILAIVALVNGAFLWAIVWVVCAVLVAALTGGIRG